MFDVTGKGQTMEFSFIPFTVQSINMSTYYDVSTTRIEKTLCYALNIKETNKIYLIDDNAGIYRSEA